MKITNLADLANGERPKDSAFKYLSESRKEIVLNFVSNIPSNYDISEINKDLLYIEKIKNGKLFKIINDFGSIGVIAAIAFLILYAILFGIWWGVFTGAMLLIASLVLDDHLDDIYELSDPAKKLLKDYSALYGRLLSEQRKENEANNK